MILAGEFDGQVKTYRHNPPIIWGELELGIGVVHKAVAGGGV
jgi:hypothetical protein